MRKRSFVTTAALAGLTIAAMTGTAKASICSLSDIDIAINGADYHPQACRDSIGNGSPSAETSNLNAAFSTSYVFLAKDDGTSDTVNGIKFSVSNAAGTSGDWTMSWTDTNGNAPLNLPVEMSFEAGLFGGNNGAAYLFQDVILLAPPNNSGSGDFNITFKNIGENYPAISHLTLIGGDMQPVTPPVPTPEPASVALLGASLFAVGMMRRRKANLV